MIGAIVSVLLIGGGAAAAVVLTGGNEKAGNETRVDGELSPDFVKIGWLFCFDCLEIIFKFSK